MQISLLSPFCGIWYTVRRIPLVFLFSLFIFHSAVCFGQDIQDIEEMQDMPEESSLLDVLDEPVLVTDTVIPIQEQEAIADTVLRNFNTMYTPVTDDLLNDSTQKRYFWRITERTGEIIEVQPDSLLTDFSNRQLVEGKGIAMQYLGNLGSPAQSRFYFERPERSDFMFEDNFSIYSKTPGTFNFVNTKIPYSNLSYITAGNRLLKEERLTGALSVNFGKKLNVGLDIDYLYARGYYQSQAVRRLDWVFYGSYISDRHRLHAFVNPSNHTNAENGGITNDLYITDPQALDSRSVQTRDIPTVMRNTWNYVKGMRYFLNYRYNLGFERETNERDSLGQFKKQFIPVASVIYTFDYNDKFRRFNSTDSTNLNRLYESRKPFFYNNQALRDSTSYWRLRNTLGLSLREGFSNWAKFDLTGFITQDVRNYTIMTTGNLNEERHQTSTYIGGEIAKRKGKILRYDAQGEFGVLGYNMGDFSLSGNIETRIPVFGDTASLTGSAYTKNTSPTFYENTFRSKYFVWDNKFNKIRKVFFGGILNIPHTKTNLRVGVENITDYIYFNPKGEPEQFSGNIQVLGAVLEQNMRVGILNWNNQLTYQKSSENNILPLPDWSLYSNLFIQFKIAKVLTVQMGGGMHYFTKYYAPTYEPVTQQFHLQDIENEEQRTKIGNYPLLNAYINCHLKQARFFVEFYNVSSSFISYPAYFSTPHYPVNPQIFKMGLAVYFNN